MKKKDTSRLYTFLSHSTPEGKGEETKASLPDHGQQLSALPSSLSTNFLLPRIHFPLGIDRPLSSLQRGAPVDHETTPARSLDVIFRFLNGCIKKLFVDKYVYVVDAGQGRTERGALIDSRNDQSLRTFLSTFFSDEFSVLSMLYFSCWQPLRNSNVQLYTYRQEYKTSKKRCIQTK